MIGCVEVLEFDDEVCEVVLVLLELELVPEIGVLIC